MVIRVQRKDGLYDMVPAQVLDRMLQEGCIMRFMRSVGWVNVGTDKIRSCSNGNYAGEERRKCLMELMQA
jgi:hypothetical protein